MPSCFTRAKYVQIRTNIIRILCAFSILFTVNKNTLRFLVRWMKREQKWRDVRITVFLLFICDALRVPLYNLKNVQNTHWGVLLTHWQPEACSINKSYTSPSAFLMFFKLCTHGTKSHKASHIFELLEFLRQTLMHWSNIQQKHSCIYLFYLSIYYKNTIKIAILEQKRANSRQLSKLKVYTN